MLFLLLACSNGKESAELSEDVPQDCTSVPGNICTWAGTPGVAAYDGGDQHRLESYFYWPMDIEFSPYGQPVINDWNNHKIRMLEANGTLRTIMGTNFIGDGDLEQQDQVAPGVPGTTVNLNHPTDAIYYPNGTLLSAGWHTFKFRTWDPATDLVHVYWGTGPGFAGEGGADATGGMNAFLKAVVMDSHENLYFIDQKNERVRELSADYKLYTIAGNGTVGFAGDGDVATNANFAFPKSVQPEPGGAIALSADEKTIYVADTENNRIRAIDLDTGIISTIAGTGTAGFSGDGGPATQAELSSPRDLEVDSNGVIYIADTENHRIRMIDSSGNISTLAGNGTAAFSGDDGPATEASLNRPFGVSLGTDGNLYIADTYNQVIRVLYR